MSAATTNVKVADAGPLVRDVMLAQPETLPSTATVADARAHFESPRQKLILVSDGARYAGALTRESLHGADDAAELGSLTMADVPTLAPGDPMQRALDLGASRTPVVDGNGELAGLVCFNGTVQTFCVLA